MASLIKVTGVQQMISKQKAVALALGKTNEINLKRAGLFVLRESKKIVPVDTGTLKGSGFARNVGGPGWLADVIVGYTAKYAIYVHENPHAKHKEGKTYKFLEKVIRDQRKQILKIVGGGKL